MAKRPRLMDAVASAASRKKKQQQARQKPPQQMQKQSNSLSQKDMMMAGDKSMKSTENRRKVQVNQRATVPFGRGDSVLLVGEGNFSFAKSLVDHYCDENGTNVVATSFDSEQVCNGKYPEAQENVLLLRQAGAKVFFGVDARALRSCKPLRGRKFDRIVFNFPHVGTGEKDQDRNIRLNQTMLLGFFRSCPEILARQDRQQGRGKSVKRKVEDVDSDDESGTDAIDSNEDNKEGEIGENIIDNENKDELGQIEKIQWKRAPSKYKGTVIVTLRTGRPYSLWELPMLAKKGPQMASRILPHPANKEPHLQPSYTTVRSFSFDPRVYPGYAHRRTIGYQVGISTDKCEDIILSARQRRTENGGSAEENLTDGPRTWEFFPI